MESARQRRHKGVDTCTEGSHETFLFIHGDGVTAIWHGVSMLVLTHRFDDLSFLILFTMWHFMCGGTDQPGLPTSISRSLLAREGLFMGGVIRFVTLAYYPLAVSCWLKIITMQYEVQDPGVHALAMFIALMCLAVLMGIVGLSVQHSLKSYNWYAMTYSCGSEVGVLRRARGREILFFWFIAFAFWKRFAIATILVTTRGTPTGRCVFVIVLFCLYFIFLTVFRPYGFLVLHRMHFLDAILSIVLVGLLLSSESIADLQGQDRRICIFVVVLLCLWFVVLLLSFLSIVALSVHCKSIPWLTKAFMHRTDKDLRWGDDDELEEPSGRTKLAPRPDAEFGEPQTEDEGPGTPAGAPITPPEMENPREMTRVMSQLDSTGSPPGPSSYIARPTPPSQQTMKPRTPPEDFDFDLGPYPDGPPAGSASPVPVPSTGPGLSAREPPFMTPREIEEVEATFWEKTASPEWDSSRDPAPFATLPFPEVDKRRG